MKSLLAAVAILSAALWLRIGMSMSDAAASIGPRAERSATAAAPARLLGMTSPKPPASRSVHARRATEAPLTRASIDARAVLIATRSPLRNEI